MQPVSEMFKWAYMQRWQCIIPVPLNLLINKVEDIVVFPDFKLYISDNSELFPCSIEMRKSLL